MERGKNRGERKEERADRLGSPPPHSNQGGEDTEGRRRRRERVGPMLQAQLHVNPIIISHEYLN